MARTRLTTTTITSAAFDVVDDDGVASLSLSSVAAILEVRPSALYTHVDGMDGLHELVATASTRDLADQVRDAAVGVAGADAIESMCAAYRRYADAHPGRYAAMLLTPSMPSSELQDALQSLVDVFSLVFRSVGMPSAEADRLAVTTRAMLHGHAAIVVAGQSTATTEDPYADMVQSVLGWIRP